MIRSPVRPRPQASFRPDQAVRSWSSASGLHDRLWSGRLGCNSHLDLPHECRPEACATTTAYSVLSPGFGAPLLQMRSPRLLAARAAVTNRHQRVAVSQPSPSPAWLSPGLRTPWQRPPIAAAGRLPPPHLGTTCRCQAPPQMLRSRAPIRFRRCLAPAPHFLRLSDFTAPISPWRSPRLPPFTLLGPIN